MIGLFVSKDGRREERLHCHMLGLLTFWRLVALPSRRTNETECESEEEKRKKNNGRLKQR